MNPLVMAVDIACPLSPRKLPSSPLDKFPPHPGIGAAQVEIEEGEDLSSKRAERGGQPKI